MNGGMHCHSTVVNSMNILDFLDICSVNCKISIAAA